MRNVHHGRGKKQVQNKRQTHDVDPRARHVEGKARCWLPMNRYIGASMVLVVPRRRMPGRCQATYEYPERHMHGWNPVSWNGGLRRRVSVSSCEAR